MIEFKNISKFYSKNGQSISALDHINLTIVDGTIFGIIGYSGAGKSTLIRLINLLERPSEGQIVIDQKEMTSLSAKELRKERTNIGMIFQHFNLLQTKTVAENIELPMKLLGVPKAKRQQRLNELLEFIDLQHKKDAFPDELSGGQKQRVGIARALTNHPQILLCDEATSALDPQTTKSVLDLLKKINKEQKITIVVVTHEMDVIEYLCDEVAVMEAGKVIEHGPTVEIFSQPKHPTTKTFIETVFQQHLPDNILNKLARPEPETIFRLQFLGGSAHQPVIQNVIRDFDVEFNILFSNMTEINGTVIGQMFVQILGQSDVVSNAVQYMKDHDVRVSQAEGKS